jgi:hypothetical protein
VAAERFWAIFQGESRREPPRQVRV